MFFGRLNKERGPIGVMLAEHTKGRFFVRAMGKAVSGLKAKELRARKQFIEKAKGDINLLTQHIARKTTFFFPWAIAS